LKTGADAFFAAAGLQSGAIVGATSFVCVQLGCALQAHAPAASIFTVGKTEAGACDVLKFSSKKDRGRCFQLSLLEFERAQLSRMFDVQKVQDNRCACAIMGQ
jgi:hypothetical protein